MGILQNTTDKLAADIRAAVLNQPDKTYEALATEHEVSRSFVQEIVRRLKAETGYTRPRGRRPRRYQAS